MSVSVNTIAHPVTTRNGGRYDGFTIALHWTTAILVVTLFALAEAWNLMPNGTPLRKLFQSWHVSLGIILAATIVTRLVWRSLFGRHLPGEANPITRAAGWAAHVALYALLIAQASLGVTLRWAQGESLSLFGLFSIPAAFAPSKALENASEDLHNTLAWAIMGIALIHASAALWHHYAKHDGILRRMLPARTEP